MPLSPNAGSNKYLFEKQSGIIHNLKNETENCKILEVTPAKASLTSTYKQAEEIALIKYGKSTTACKFCCKD